MTSLRLIILMALIIQLLAGIASPSLSSPQINRPRIISREEWGARPPKCNYRANPYYNAITIHHTATSNDYTDGAAVVRSIQKYHMDVRGWCDIGYHFLIDKYGNIYEGRPIWAVGAHVKGHNTGNIGVAVIGNFEEAVPNSEILDALAELVTWLVYEYGIPIENIKGHRDYAATSCPGRYLYEKLSWLRNEVKRRLESASEEYYDVRVKILNDLGEPLHGAIVELDGLTDETDIWGEVYFRDIKGGSYTINVYWDDIKVYGKSCKISSNCMLTFKVPVIHLNFTAITESGVLLNNYILEISGIKNLTINVTKGYYVLKNVPAGKFHVKIYFLNRLVYNKSMSMYTSSKVALRCRVHMLKVYLKGEDGKNINQAKVIVLEENKELSTYNVSGGYALILLPEGSYTLRIESDEYTPLTAKVNVSSDTVVQLALEPGEPDDPFSSLTTLLTLIILAILLGLAGKKVFSH